MTTSSANLQDNPNSKCRKSNVLPGEEIVNLLNDSSQARGTASLHCDLGQYLRIQDVEDRRFYLYGDIDVADNDIFGESSSTSWLIEQIMTYDRMDRGIPPHKREPVRLYINSPGSDLIEGTALFSAIEISKTPIYTINIGQWCSMAFLIGITGDKRFSLPNATFLMHDGTSGTFGSTSKVQDQMEFEKRFEKEFIKAHVLKKRFQASKSPDEYCLAPTQSHRRRDISRRHKTPHSAPPLAA